MPKKLKTVKSAAKRFKVTGSGKIVAYGTGHSHHLAKKSSSKKKAQIRKRAIEGGDLKTVKKMVPYLKN